MSVQPKTARSGQPLADNAARERVLAGLPVISRLAEGHSLVVPDLPGLGESEPVGRLDDHGDLLRRLVIYAAPGIGPYRFPLRLMVVATLFSIRPSERNAERFDRFALLDLDRTRERDPDWFGAFSRYTLSRAVVPHVKRTMGS
jgi:pimeloyl-ACP methyl ester carboxylesterase